MSAVLPHRPGADERTASGPRPLDAVLLTALLVVGWWCTGAGIPFMSDEGQAEVQVDLLEQGTWVHDPPFDTPGGLDPQGAATPFRQQGAFPEGTVPYGKHPVYPTLLGLARDLAGGAGTVLVSIGGAVAAAWLAAALARELGARDPRPAFWLCGVASPLFYDGLIVFAHTLAAAFVTVALLGLVRLDRAAVLGGPRLPMAAGALALCGAALLRNEALLVAGGAAAAVVLVGRGPVPRRLLAAGCCLAGAVAALVLDRALRTALFGAPLDQAPPVAGPGSSIAGRVDAALLTLLEPGLATPALLRLGLMVWLVALAAVVRTAVRRPEGVPLRLVVGVVAAGGALQVLRLLATPDDPVPGLLVAFPAVVVLGAALAGARPPRPVLVVAAVLGIAALGVLALQYDRGGGLEWGGRFFAVLLPGVAALVTVLLQRLLPGVTGRVIATALLAIGVVTAAGSLLTLRGFRSATDGLAAAVTAAGVEAGQLDPAVLEPGHEPRPLVVTTQLLLPQILQPVFADHHWLAPDPEALPALAGRLDAAGVDRFVLVASGEADELDALAAWRVEAEVPSGRGGIPVYVMARDG